MTKFSKITKVPLLAAAGFMFASGLTPASAAYDARMTEEQRSIAYLAHSPAMPTPLLVQAAKPAPSPQIAMPGPEALIVMIRSSVVALGHANITNNYTVLHQMGSANFRKENGPKKLAKLFAPFRSNKIDLAPVVFLTPQLTQAPKIEKGRLRMVGYFPSQPMRVNFDLMFEPSEGQWKLFGMGVDLKRAAARPAAVSPQFKPGNGAQTKGR